MSRATSASRPLGRPKDGDSAETRSRLLAVARELFAERGFDATTNKDIAARAGLTTGAIYHYYPSKAELYAAVCEEVLGYVYARFDAVVAEQCTLLGQFSAVLDEAVEINGQDPSATGFVVAVAVETQTHPELMRLYGPMRGTTSRFINRLVSEAVARGELAAGVPPQAVADLMSAILLGFTRFSNYIADPARHARAVDAMKRLVAGTLMAPSAEG